MTVKDSRCGRLLVVAVVVAVVAMLTVVVGGGCVGCKIVGWGGVGIVLRVVRKRPELRLPAGFPYSFENLFLICPPCHRYFLQVHIYVDVVHA